jgi:hypothetical protein
MMVRLLPEKTINPSRGRLSHVWARPAILASLMGLALAGVSLFASDRVQGTIALAIVGIGIGLLLELVLRQDWAAHRLDSISQLLNTIDQLPPDLVLATQKRLKTYAEAARMAERQTTFEQALSDRMDGLQEWLEHVTHGRLRVDLGTSALLTDSFSECSTVNAVTRATASLEWWSSEAGDRYWEANVSALRSGVTINRIYVGDSSLSTAQQACLMRFLRRELEARTALGRGGEVFYVEAAELRALFFRQACRPHLLSRFRSMALCIFSSRTP